MTYRFRRYKRSSYRRRYFKRPALRRRRIMRRMNSRRPRMEIKHIDNSGTFSTTTGATLITEITPGNIPIGVLQFNATGRWVKSRVLTFEGNGHVESSADPSLRIIPYRVVIASPRIDLVNFQTYFNSTASFAGGTSIDPSVCTVYHDFIYPIANPFWIPAGASNTPSQASNPNSIIKLKKYIKFPRKIQLGNNGDILDAKDQCFIITRALLPVDPVNPTFTFMGWRSKLSFIDI